MRGADDDELLFADEGPDAPAEADAPHAPRVALLVDDDPAVAMVPRLVFSPMRGDSPLEQLVTHPGEAGRKVLESRQDIAVAILDVVTETEEAGLNLARWIRKQSARARTLLTGQVRLFRDLQAIGRQRADLEAVLRSMSRLAEPRGVNSMTRDIFRQVSMLLGDTTPPMWLSDLVRVSAAPRGRWYACSRSVAGAVTTGPRWDLHSASLRSSRATRRVHFADAYSGDEVLRGLLALWNEPPPTGGGAR